MKDSMAPTNGMNQPNRRKRKKETQHTHASPFSWVSSRLVSSRLKTTRPPPRSSLTPPQGAAATGTGSSEGRPAPDSSSVARGPPVGTGGSRAPRRGAVARRFSGRTAGSRAPAPSCPPDPSAAPPTLGSPRTLGGICVIKRAGRWRGRFVQSRDQKGGFLKRTWGAMPRVTLLFYTCRCAFRSKSRSRYHGNNTTEAISRKQHHGSNKSCTCTVFTVHLTPEVGSKLISFALPLSQTKRTPSIVTLVSAMFVARIIFRVPRGEASNTFRDIKSPPPPRAYPCVSQSAYFGSSPPFAQNSGADDATAFGVGHAGKGKRPTTPTVSNPNARSWWCVSFFVRRVR